MARIKKTGNKTYIDKVRPSGAASGSSDAAHDEPVDNNHYPFIS